jgi:ATP-dependent Lon protease
LPFDISRIFFIVTANTLDTIPPPLLDRMEIIQVSGYIDTEKLEIAKRYLVPKSLEKNGLRKSQVKYNAESLLHIANGYAREAGVRNFENNLDKIHRKLAREIVRREEANRGTQAGAACPGNDAAQPGPNKGDKLRNESVGPLGGSSEEGVGSSEELRVLGGEGAKAEKVPGTLVKFAIDKKVVEEHLGKPLFPEGDLKRADRPGMSVGLAWTSLGGDTLVIEATSVPGKEGLTLTGKMGDTMKESATIAMTVARKLAVERFGLAVDWFEKNHVHLHIPEGATPKDGPSAGITMATAFLSLMRGQTIVDRLAMTGELSLTGQVLPIGGLKEKTIAARRNKAKHIIIPKQNVRDLDEIPDHVKKGIEFHPVERFDEVLALALP